MGGYRAFVRLFGRRRRPAAARTAFAEGVAHLEQWARSRQGVEAYVEPRTAVTETTVLMVAASGEWTRRPVDGPEGATTLAKRLAIPLYDAGVVGYPARMREWNQRQKDNGAAS
jgi:hypothetical protein